MSTIARTALALMIVDETFAFAEDRGDFVTLDRPDSTSQVGAEVSYVRVGSGIDAGHLLLYGEYLHPDLGAGGYFQLPASYFRTSDRSAFAVGDLEIGGVLARHFDWTDVVLHAGLAFPSAPSDAAGEAANTFGAPARITDYYLNIPSGTSLRVGVSPIAQRGQLFARMDVGFDLNLANSTGMMSSAERINIGVGGFVGHVAGSLEITNIRINGNNGLWIDTGAVSARINLDAVQPYAAVVVPLDQDSRVLFGLAITAGATYRR